MGRTSIDASEVTPRLFQGGALDPARSYHVFSMLVFCAVEHVPDLPRYRGKELYARLRDVPAPTEVEIARAHACAEKVAAEIRAGGRVLVTCAMGLNRSGLVVGLALNRLTKLAPDRIVRKIRDARGVHALTNEAFVAEIARCNRAAGCLLC